MRITSSRLVHNESLQEKKTYHFDLFLDRI